MGKIVLGADHGGFRLKEKLAEHLRANGWTVEDVGCYDETSVDYPEIGRKLAETIRALGQASGEQPLGVLCCGSGIGISISANRFPWIRAVVAHEHHSAVMSRRHNDANVLCMGGRVIAPELACEILDTWLSTSFDGGRHQRRVDQMSQMGDLVK